MFYKLLINANRKPLIVSSNTNTGGTLINLVADDSSYLETNWPGDVGYQNFYAINVDFIGNTAT